MSLLFFKISVPHGIPYSRGPGTFNLVIQKIASLVPQSTYKPNRIVKFVSYSILATITENPALLSIPRVPVPVLFSTVSYLNQDEDLTIKAERRMDIKKKGQHYINKGKKVAEESEQMASLFY